MPSCPACGRSVALARADCLYCGAPLAAAAVAPAEPAPSAAPQAAPRVLVLLDLAGSEPSTLAGALGVSRYEATLLARRGGLHLVRAVAPGDAEAEAERLKARGAEPWLVPEAEVRAAPLLCLAGERRGSDELLLRTTQGPVTLARGDALLIVQGAITREYQTPAEPRRIATARPEEGYRVQVHRRADTRALEIDALNFELGFAVSGSARLEIDAWLDAVAGDAPRDSGFARLGAVLGPTAPEPGGALAAAGTLAAASSGGAGESRPVVLDNLAQFRFYSGCLAAVYRRRTARSPPGV
jgi:hypothetical protein